MKAISIILLLASAYLSIKHGWDSFQPPGSEQGKMIENLGIPQAVIPYFGVFSIIVGLLLFFRPTFFISNVLNAATILLVMALCLRPGDTKQH